MWFLSEMFDDVVDIASVPVKAAATITDHILYPFEEWGINTVRPAVDNLRESIRINEKD